MRAIAEGCRPFFRQQVDRLAEFSIDVSGYPVGHLAVRTPTRDSYVSLRWEIEAASIANEENVWNGRPISKLLLARPLDLGPHHSVSLIELIPPPHRRAYRMGLEHVGFVLGDELEWFADTYASIITERQDQGPFNQPLRIAFADGTSVKFHQRSLEEVVRMQGGQFDSFSRVT